MISGRDASARRALLWLAACLLAVLPAACGERPAAVADVRSGGGGPPRPTNIVWMVADALGAPLGTHAASLAAAGSTYDVAGRPASGATLRSELLTGIGAEALGLTDEGLAAPPAAGVSVVPERLRRAGYYTSRSGPPLHNLSDLSNPAKADPEGAADDALAQPGLLGAWDAAGPEADWRGRRKDWEYPCTVAFGCGGAPHDPERPFFALFNLTASGDALDAEVGRVLAALAEDGLERTTAVFLIGSAGQAPVIARWPAGTTPDAAGGGHLRPVDLAPTALALAGAPVPEYMTGRALLGVEERTGAEPGFDSAGAPPAPTGAEPPSAAAPAGYPTGGLFHVAPRVALSCDTEGSTIVYTTEREAPFHWRLYTGPFRMRFWTLRVQCGRLGYRDSEMVRYEFDIE